MTGAVSAQPSQTQFSGVHADLAGLAADDHLQYALLAGRAGGQTLIGGTAAAETLSLQGTAAADRGTINTRGAVNVDYDWTTDQGSNAIRWANTIPASGGALAGFLQRAQTVTVNNGLFITSSVDDASSFTWTVSPGFAVSTLFFARPNYITQSAGVPPAQAFIYAAQAQYWNNGAGAVTTTNYRGFSFAPIIRAETAGDDMRIGACDGLTVGPLWNTRNATATADYGAITGVRLLNGGQVLFGQSLGSEICDSYIGLDVPNLTQPIASIRRAAVRSALVASTINRFLENTSTAESDFGAGDIHLNDGTIVKLGGTVTAYDVGLQWNNATSSLLINFVATADNLQLSNPAAEAFLLQPATVAGSELRTNFEGYVFGGSGALGNQFVNIQQPALTVGVAGGWAGILLTQAGSLDIGAFAMSDVAAWVINATSLANATGSIADLDTLVVGGMTTSNPGITVTRRAALRVTGRHTQRGLLSFPPLNPAALSSGNNNDWAGFLTGSPNNATRFWARVTGDAAGSDITGIDTSAMQDGDTGEITNVGTASFRLMHQDAASSASNRIITPDGNAFVVAENETVRWRYDETTDRIRIMSQVVIAGGGALSGAWQYDDTVTMADPGAGSFRTNNNTVGSVTAIAIADETETGVDAGGILAALASGDQLYLFNKEDAGEFLVFDITSNTDNTGWHEFAGTVNASGNNFTDGKEFIIVAIFA